MNYQDVIWRLAPYLGRRSRDGDRGRPFVLQRLSGVSELWQGDVGGNEGTPLFLPHRGGEPPGEPDSATWPSADEVRRFGARLFSALPPEAVAPLRRDQKGKNVVRLLIVSEVPWLANVPWEWLCRAADDPSAVNRSSPLSNAFWEWLGLAANDPSADNGPLALQDQVRLLRFQPLHFPTPVPRAKLPIRVLLVLADPEEDASLEQEFQTVKQALQGCENVKCDVCQDLTERFSARNQSGRNTPQVVHIVSHAARSGGEGYLVSCDRNGRTTWLSPQDLAALLPSDTGLVCLTTHGDAPPQELAGLRSVAFASSLSIPTVASQCGVGADSLGSFWSRFYQELLQREGNVIEALHAGRRAVKSGGKSGREDGTGFVGVLRDPQGLAFVLETTAPASNRTDADAKKKEEARAIRQEEDSSWAQLKARLTMQLANSLAAHQGLFSEESQARLSALSEEQASRARDYALHGRWLESDFSDQLAQSLDEFAFDETAQLCDNLLAHLRSRAEPYPVEAAKRDLAALRRKRRFELMARVADAHLRSGQDNPTIRRQYAQALIELDQMTAALAVLADLLADQPRGDREWTEAKGLMGRAYKQIYVDAPARAQKALRRAIDAYLEGYLVDLRKNTWHGINAASCLARAQRDGIAASSRAAHRGPEKIASEILKYFEGCDTSQNLAYWDLSTAAEACVVRADYDKAALYLQRYVDDPHVDAFEVASTYRQFREVHQLDREQGPQWYLLELLRAQLLLREGSTLTIEGDDLTEPSPAAPTAEGLLEPELESLRTRPQDWLRTGLERARSVARVWLNGQPVALGVLLSGNSLKESWGESSVILTTWSGASDPPSPDRIPSLALEVSFDAHGPSERPPRLPAILLWSSPDTAVGVAVLELREAPETSNAVPVTALPPALSRQKKYGDVYLINASPDAPSAQICDVHVVDVHPMRVQYRLPDAPASCGGPLFDAKWQLLGIHVRGEQILPRLDDPLRTRRAAEGVLVNAVRRELSQQDTAGP